MNETLSSRKLNEMTNKGGLNEMPLTVEQGYPIDKGEQIMETQPDDMDQVSDVWTVYLTDITTNHPNQDEILAQYNDLINVSQKHPAAAVDDLMRMYALEE